MKGKALGRKLLMDVAGIVTPDTILRWYRALIAKKYDGSARRGAAGRPRTAQKIADLIVRIANENPRFGYTRIRDALRNLGLGIARNTVKRILTEHGIEPAPERGKRTCWKSSAAFSKNPVSSRSNSAQPSALLEGVGDKADFYFVHSYHFDADQADSVAATCDYGQQFTASVSRKNVFGVQFHPEKSQKAGKLILENFLKL